MYLHVVDFCITFIVLQISNYLIRRLHSSLNLRVDTVIHVFYVCVWVSMFLQARRSMRFAKHLRDAANDFRKQHLGSTDDSDQTLVDDDWTTMKVG